ncbi:hypothetical protein BDV26DRAFT_292566 [Aspergillus bertholletiae]|uniref:Uncharacterized protein n=1 Tax=Aspergillus bertholletiae TaxID=1226010 RepID=A0A5N7B8L5_9EURO|nr:hypothetical protein BDV26DRAFT_292566 [Aspergillus bertholletiae]
MSSISASTPGQQQQQQSSIDDQVEELDDYSFYHHPTWSQRWPHPDFAEEAMKAWEKRPWSKHEYRLSRGFLCNTMPFLLPWGYIIYHTVYASESDKIWPLAMVKLTRYINDEIEQDLRLCLERYSDDPRPEQLVQESREDFLISDKEQWNSTGIEQIRRRFVDYRCETKIGMYRGCGRFAACKIIDELSPKSIIAAPEKDGYP